MDGDDMHVDPYANTFPTNELPVALPELTDGAFPAAGYSSETGAGRSPAVTWETLPEGTQSLLVTVFDPDAPVPGGFWHWIAVVPADAGQLVAGASGQGMPEGSIELPNSFGVAGYVGPNPPQGTGVHGNVVAVTALSVPVHELPDVPSTAMLHASIIPATLARGTAVGTATAA
jgi:Raf kinase inhibitor-like YbhB/YbcL family protein